MKKYLSSYPELVKEWHPTKNGDLNPKDLTHGMSKKVWWLCPKGHSYQSRIYERARHDKPSGCPYCAGRKANEGNSLEALHPKIANEWHPDKNNKLIPSKVTVSSHKKVWWLCPKGHSYQSAVYSRTRKHKSGCPYCAGKKPSKDYNLEKLFPDITQEWHPIKNGNLTPNLFLPRSDKKVWWLCPKGHSYYAIIHNRTRERGCPYCSNQSSAPEIRIFSELKFIFDKITNRHKIDGIEIDIYLSDYRIGIEFDGEYWHKDRKKKDLEKNKYLASKGIHLFRVRQKPLSKISENDVLVSLEIKKSDLNKIFIKIISYVDSSIKEKIDNYLLRKTFANENLYKKYRSYFPSPFPDKSLKKTHPELCQAWDNDKNFPLKPENFSYGSQHKVWWLCPKGHSYDSTIKNRTKGRDCPYCAGKKTYEGNSLEALNPKIANEWHPQENGEMTPKNVTIGSSYKAWWLCPKGHSYQARISDRSKNKGTNCPYCSGRKASKINNFLLKNPVLASDWHPTKNGDLKPENFTAGSGKKVWWLCSKNNLHEWQATINYRSQRNSCPYCSGRKTLNYD